MNNTPPQVPTPSDKAQAAAVAAAHLVKHNGYSHADAVAAVAEAKADAELLEIEAAAAEAAYKAQHVAAVYAAAVKAIKE
jgi:hypothetical protein